MTARVKTVEFPFVTRTTALTAATRHDFSSITLDIPENTSRTFRSVYVEVTCCDHEASGGVSLTSRLIGIKLGATAFDDDTNNDDIIDTFARKHFLFTRDVTSYFNTNFGSGTSQTCQVGVQIGGIATQTITAKLVVTYEFDDSGQNTRVKTVKIPIQSNTGLLSATLTELGTNQVPNLSTFLTESTISYKHMWFEFGAQEAAQDGTDFNLAVSLDAEAEVSMGTLEMALGSSTEFFAIWVRNDMTTNATHALKARSTTANRMSNLGALLCVTYTYDHSTTTTLLNSLELVMPNTGERIGANESSANSASRSQMKFFIEEPGTITLKQSGVLFRSIHGAANQASATFIRCGSQIYTNYTINVSSNSDCGGFSVVHRIDSGGSAGAGISIARGENTFTLDGYVTTNTVPYGAGTPLLILNYTSDLASGGAETHSHTTKWCLQSMVSTTNYQLNVSAFAPNIPETNYYTTNIGYKIVKTHESPSPYTVIIERLSGEDYGDGWANLISAYVDLIDTFTVKQFAYASDLFDRNPGEVDAKRLAVEGSRAYRMFSGHTGNATAGMYSMVMFLTHHCFTYTVAGTVTGYTGDGSGITVKVHRSDTDEYVATGTTSTGGAFSITWYDSVIPVYCQARQDSTHRGRSDNSNAV